MRPPPHPIRRLGEGGMGEVWLAEDPDRGLVALKCLRPELTQNDHIGRFRSEFATLARLRHPNLVKAWDYHVDPDTGRHSYTMEIVQGLDFTAATGGLPPEQICALAEQVCDALEHVHAHDLVHGDVKPANIIVVGDQVRLMDFGLVNHPGQGQRRGSLDTLAPEVIQGRPHDRRADLYALGAVLFEALTRHPPFTGPSRFTLLRAHLRSRPLFPARLAGTVPEPIQAVVLRLLNKNPSSRYFTAAETAVALRAARGAAGRRPLTATALGSSPLPLGRESELAALEQAIREASAGAGPTVRVVAGAPGSGKAALLRELRSRLASRRFLHATAACTRDPEPLAIVRDWLQALSAQASPEWPRLRTALATLLDPGGAFAAAEAVDAASRRLPLALLLENAEWADPGTQQFVATLSRMRHARTTVILTVTPGEGRARWETPSEITLGRIDARCVELLALRMTGAHRVDPELVAALDAATGGMPGAVRSCLRTLAAENALFLQDGLLRATAPPASGPELSRLLEFLSTDARLAAESLAVSRFPATVADAASIAGLAQDRAAAALFDLEYRGIAARDDGRSEPTWRLRAPGLAPVILKPTPLDTLRAMHLAAADLARGRHSIEDAARHLFDAGGGPDAVAAALQAADSLLKSAPAAAVPLLEAALADPAASEADTRRARILLADALLRLSRPADAARLLLTVADCAPPDSRDDTRLRAAAALSTAEPARAMDIASSLPASPRTREVLVRALLTEGHFERAASLAGLTPETASLRTSRARAALALGRAQDALADARLAWSECAPDSQEALEAAACAAESAATLRDLSATASWTDRVSSMRISIARLPAIAEDLRARMLELRRQPADAIAAWRSASSAARDASAHDLLARASSSASALLLAHDRFDAALHLAAEAETAGRLTPDVPARAAALCAAARASAAVGLLGTADLLASEALTVATPGGPSPLLATILTTRALCRLAARRIEEARADHDQARRTFAPAADPAFDAEAALAAGDDAAALRLTTRARSGDARTGVRLANARTRALLASGEAIGVQAAIEEGYDLLARARDFGTTSALRCAHQTLGLSLAAHGMSRSARDHLRAALDLLRDTLSHVPPEARPDFLNLPENTELRLAILRLGGAASPPS